MQASRSLLLRLSEVKATDLASLSFLISLLRQVGKEARETTVILRNNNPRWAKGNKFTFYDVDISKISTVDVEVVSSEGLASIGLKESLGEASVFLGDIVDSRQVGGI
jgi:hypothetical protein